jgi:hypothetical protein
MPRRTLLCVYNVNWFPLGSARSAATRGDGGEHNVEDDESLDAQDQSGLVLGADDARVVVDFAVGPSGVGPAMGFDSDDFFPSAPDADIDRNRTD